MSRWNYNNYRYENDNINELRRDCNNDTRGCDCNCQNDPCSDENSRDCLICPPGPQGPADVAGAVGPVGNSAALTITPLAGGTRPVSAHLVITQIG